MTNFPIQLNIGCGQKHKKDFINIDINSPADVYCRVGTISLPLETSSVDYAEADNFLEHLNNEEFLFAMNDIWRVLKPGAEFWIRVPDVLKWPAGAFGDPTHKMFFTARTFDYFTPCNLYRMHGKGYGFKPWIKKKSIIRENGFLIARIKPIK